MFRVCGALWCSVVSHRFIVIAYVVVRLQVARLWVVLHSGSWWGYVGACVLWCYIVVWCYVGGGLRQPWCGYVWGTGGGFSTMR